MHVCFRPTVQRGDEFMIMFLRTVPCAKETEGSGKKSPKSQCCSVLLSWVSTLLSNVQVTQEKIFPNGPPNLLRWKYVVHPVPRNYCDWKSAALHDLGGKSPQSKVRQPVRSSGYAFPPRCLSCHVPYSPPTVSFFFPFFLAF